MTPVEDDRIKIYMFIQKVLFHGCFRQRYEYKVEKAHNGSSR
uniref:Uncharacterized protein n=1 Tax=Anguilla anguilla TaxID=7936 RepID=A0A0E9QQ05_ANGAN